MNFLLFDTREEVASTGWAIAEPYPRLLDRCLQKLVIVHRSPFMPCDRA